MTATDVLVLGAGPAGWAAAAACATAGLQVHLVAPAPHARWPQTYGAWLDELTVTGLPALARCAWDRVLVRTVGPGFRPLARTYCLIDNDRLRAVLADRATAVTTTVDHARRFDLSNDHLVVTTGSGARLPARAVIDATGYPSRVAARPAVRLARQTAYGVVARFDRPPLEPGTMCLMDFDARAFDDDAPPTFLYAMDLGGGRWFVEETSLAARPGVPLATLRRRLDQRLAARGVVPTHVEHIERVAFAMDAPVVAHGPVIAFGAAAGMVHPATGYHVAAMLQRAPALATAVAAALDEHDDLDSVARAGHGAVWSDADLRRDALYRLGLDVLLSLDTAATQAFFDGFFSLPLPDWRGYVSRTASPLQVQRTMVRLMARVPPPVGRRVARTIVADGAWRRLAGAVRPGWLSA